MALIYIVVILVCTTSVHVGAQGPCICSSQPNIDTLIARLQDISTLESRLHNLENLNAALQTQLIEISSAPKPIGNQRTASGSVSTYIQWGKKSCTLNGTRTIYHGYAAGGHYGHSGKSPNMLCLPSHPEWAKYDERQNGLGGLLYGVEYEHGDKTRAKAILGNKDSLNDHDVPCAVCESDRSAHIMIPGRTTCYPGWTREYWGYLMTEHYAHTAGSDYHCVDSNPDVLDGGKDNKNGYLLYFVEVRCESLSCPPYVMGRELPCVVCTK